MSFNADISRMRWGWKAEMSYAPPGSLALDGGTIWRPTRASLIRAIKRHVARHRRIWEPVPPDEKLVL